MLSKSANVILVKTAIIFVVFCLAECAAGSCLQYGHACWGGHGKRNGGGAGGGNAGDIMRIRPDDLSQHIANTRWYLSRLVKAPADLRMWQDDRNRHMMVTRNSQDRHVQNDSEVDADFAKRPEDIEDLNVPDPLPEESDPEEVVLMEDPPQTFGQKMRLYKLLKNNAEKIN